MQSPTVVALDAARKELAQLQSEAELADLPVGTDAKVFTPPSPPGNAKRAARSGRVTPQQALAAVDADLATLRALMGATSDRTHEVEAAFDALAKHPSGSLPVLQAAVRRTRDGVSIVLRSAAFGTATAGETLKKVKQEMRELKQRINGAGPLPLSAPPLPVRSPAAGQPSRRTASSAMSTSSSDKRTPRTPTSLPTRATTSVAAVPASLLHGGVASALADAHAELAALDYLESLSRHPKTYTLPAHDPEQALQIPTYYSYVSAAYEPRVVDFYGGPKDGAPDLSPGLLSPGVERKAHELSQLRLELSQLQAMASPHTMQQLAAEEFRQNATYSMGSKYTSNASPTQLTIHFQECP